MILIELALSVLLALQQQGGSQETTFHRIYLRNGNFIDGKVISDKPNEVILLMKSGEMIIRRDQVEKIELMKMKSYNDKPIILDSGKNLPPGKAPPVAPDGVAPVTDTPEGIRKRVDAIMFKFKNTPVNDERVIPFQDIAALGEEAAVYLAARIPAFDEKSQQAMGVALIQLNSLKSSEKVKAVLEVLLTNASASVRAVAVTVLGGVTDDEQKFRLLRSLLQDPDRKVRLTTISAIGNVESKDWFDALREVCADTDPEIRARALRLARNLAEKHGLAELLTTQMIANFKHANPGVRADAAGLVGPLGIRNSWKELVTLLADPEGPVRAAAAQSLMVLGVVECGQDLTDALGREKEREVLIALIGAVQRVRAPKAIEPLIRQLASQDEEVKRLAHSALRVLTAKDIEPNFDAWNDWYSKNH